ncbi:MAG: putative sulfate exporter family transporter, partial [Desulfomonilaceae bacterium]
MSAEASSLYQKQSMLESEDWWAVWLGLFIFLLGLGPIYAKDLLGWVVTNNIWVDVTKSIKPVSAGYSSLSSLASMFFTYVFMLVLTSIGIAAMGKDLKKYVVSFTIVFWIVMACMIIGNNAYIAATPNQKAAFNIPWSLSLGEMGFVVAMILGLIIGNFFPSTAKFLEDAARPEWFIKTGIVILGAAIGIKAVGALGLASTVIISGTCATAQAYLIYWPVVYYIARKYFKFTPEWAAPLASGISVCGVSAAIATGAAIRSRPVVPIILSAVIIVFVAVELLFLPWLAQAFLYQEPMVAGAWMGLVVKSDGGAVASGAITDSLISAKALKELGIKWEPGWMLMAATTTKVFIDVFIGIWAFVLAVVWSVYRIGLTDSGSGAGSAKVSAGEIWDRFPKFVIGFALTFVILLIMGLNDPTIVKAAEKGSG